MANGTLLTEDFLREGICETDAFRGLTDDATRQALLEVQAILAAVANPSGLNEAQTEERIVRPILRVLGFDGAYDVQTNLDARGRQNVPDYLLFADQAAFGRAEAASAGGSSEARTRHAVAVMDAKAWSVALDQRNRGSGAGETPSAQIIRYMSRAEANSDRAVQWGVLTNGRIWRLYHLGAKSLLEEYLEIDLAWAVGLGGIQGELFSAASRLTAEPAHAFKVFLLMFGQAAYRPGPDGRTFHRLALDEGRQWEARVRTSLSEVVFQDVFPGLIRAIADADPARPTELSQDYLEEVREAALTLLYRLLFAFYAEDRDLLPRRSRAYDDYSLSRQRETVAERVDEGDTFSANGTRIFGACADLFRWIDAGDDSIGLPAYNGGLFNHQRSAILRRTPLSDQAFAPIIDKLSRTSKASRLVRINYRDLSVRELGAIYERLLEFEPVADRDEPSGIAVRVNIFARKNSGSYYTPDELVRLIVERTIGPLVEECRERFLEKSAELEGDRRPLEARLDELQSLDPATRILALKIVDPAMGSGHFLVSVVDYLAEWAYSTLDEAPELAPWGEYHSPLRARLDAIRERIRAEAELHKWPVGQDQLTDRNLIKRVALKACIYGVDKNPMAVELAKVSLWLHTFTVGAPLSFLDHHLRCGDSLFGERVRTVMDELQRRGSLFINGPIQAAQASAAGMARIEALTDAELGEVRLSEHAFGEVGEATRPLSRFLSFWHALRWLRPLPADETSALDALLDGQFGDPVRIAAGLDEPQPPAGAAAPEFDLPEPAPEQLTFLGAASVRDYRTLKLLLARAHALAAEQHFFHWEVAFPGIWRRWESTEPEGGFDAVIGNPPWDRMKMQEVEWFAERNPAIARRSRAADRKAAIEQLRISGAPLYADYRLAADRAEVAMKVARQSGAYPLMSKGDINIYSLFVEQAQRLIGKRGLTGLLTPSGVASDLTAAPFFRSVSTAGRLFALLDFENRKYFFRDIHASFKFCAFVAGGADRLAPFADCAFYLHRAQEAGDPDKIVRLSAEDFRRVNPNTGTAPIFRDARDAEITLGIYSRLPVLVDRSAGEQRAWPVRYVRMFDMTNDSDKFWTRERLETEGAYPVDLGRWRKGVRTWSPLYTGRRIHQFNHRASGVDVVEENIHNAAVSDRADAENLADPTFFPAPQYWVDLAEVDWPYATEWGFAFRDIARATDERTLIGTLVPKAAFGNTAPLIVAGASDLWRMAATFSSFIADFVCRQKAQSTHLNWYIVEQLPVPIDLSRPLGVEGAERLIKDHVLRLSYTSSDLETLAVDLGYVAEDGAAKAPVAWDETERMHLRARLDALFFHLYGVTDEADVRYVLSTFPIVERKDRKAHGGVFLTAELIVWYLRALAAGDTGTIAPVDVILRNAALST